MIDYEEMGMDNFNAYVECTENEDWQGICDINGVPFDSFGTTKELRVLSSYLDSDEVVFAITSGVVSQTETSNSSDWGCNTWLAVLTSTRFLFLDHALLTSSVDVQSVRHEMVQATSASQGWIFGKVSIDLGSRMIVIDNCEKATVTPFVTLANTWLNVLAKCQSMPQTVAVEKSSPLDELKKLAELRAAGIVTEEEFTAAKAKLLQQI